MPTTQIRLHTALPVGKDVCEQDASAQVEVEGVKLDVLVKFRHLRGRVEDPVDVKICVNITNWEEHKVMLDRLTKVQLRFGIPGGKSWTRRLLYARCCAGQMVGECTYVHTPNDESSFCPIPSVELYLCLAARDNSALFNTLATGRVKALYPEIDVAPDFEQQPGARFTLRSNEGKCFYVHASVVAERSPVLQTWLHANHGGLREGEPLMIDCDTETLSTLLALLYSKDFHLLMTFPHVHDVLRVAQVWQMQTLVDFCVGYMRNNYHAHFVDFDWCAPWFVAVSMYAGNGMGDEQLELMLLNRLFRLAHDKQELKDRLASVVQEYEDTVMNGKDRLLALLKLRD